MNVSCRNNWTRLTALAFLYATGSHAAQSPAEWRMPLRDAIHHDVVILIHQAYADVRQRFENSLKEGSIPRSEGLGRAVARAHLRDREDDGAARTITFVPSQEPGQWRRTPPH